METAISLPGLFFFRYTSSGLSMFRQAGIKYSVPTPPLSKHRRNATGICHQPRHRARRSRYVEARNTPIGVSPL